MRQAPPCEHSVDFNLQRLTRIADRVTCRAALASKKKKRLNVCAVDTKNAKKCQWVDEAEARTFPCMVGAFQPGWDNAWRGSVG